MAPWPPRNTPMYQYNYVLDSYSLFICSYVIIITLQLSTKYLGQSEKHYSLFSIKLCCYQDSQYIKTHDSESRGQEEAAYAITE